VQGTPWLALTPQQAAVLAQQQAAQKPLFTFSLCNESKVTNACRPARAARADRSW
jgi:hypothetical protein